MFRNVFSLSNLSSISSAHPFQMTPATRLTASYKAVLLLRKKFKKGEVTADDNPKYVWLSSPTFISHNLHTFRTRFNRIKSEELGDDGKYSTFYLFLKYVILDTLH